MPADADFGGGADLDPQEELTGASPALPMPRAALVTGGGRRIGRALALALAEDGFAVAVHYHRSGGDAEAVAEAIRAKGGTALTVAADLADEEAVSGLLAQTERELGPVGCLVNNAGVFENDTVETVSRESWDLALGG